MRELRQEGAMRRLPLEDENCKFVTVAQITNHNPTITDNTSNLIYSFMDCLFALMFQNIYCCLFRIHMVVQNNILLVLKIPKLDNCSPL